eukprot:1161529-Pelagomonas_calceolata.AAC.2
MQGSGTNGGACHDRNAMVFGQCKALGGSLGHQCKGPKNMLLHSAQHNALAKLERALFKIHRSIAIMSKSLLAFHWTSAKDELLLISHAPETKSVMPLWSAA